MARSKIGGSVCASGSDVKRARQGGVLMEMVGGLGAGEARGVNG